MLVRSAAVVGLYTGLSRLVGFVRDVLLAAFLGTGPVADAFFVAFKLPNFFRSLFAEGAFNAAFVPLYSEILTRNGREFAQAFAERALAVLLAALVVFVALSQIFMPTLMLGLAPGFVDEPEKFDLAVAFTRITFPYLLLISLVSLFGGVLNSLGRFAAAAAAPILMNLTLIAALLGLTRYLPTAGHALAAGVTLSGIVQFLWLALALQRSGLGLSLPRPKLTPKVRQLIKVALPAALGAGVVQVNLVIGVILASLLPSGAISYLFYADRLNQLTIGVVGVAVGTALLPLLSRQIATAETEAALNSQNRAIELALFLALPAASALIAVPQEIIGPLFERGAFTAADTEATAAALLAYSLGLPAYVAIKALTPGFYARQDTATPVKIAALAITINILASFILMRPLAHAGLALATAISGWVNAFCLAFVLNRRALWRADARLKSRLWRMAGASLVMTAALLALAKANEAWLGPSAGERLLALSLLVGGGVLIYGSASHLIGAAKVTEIRALLAAKPGR
jgi:putative peptidoglycan lipid II flippase